MNLYGYVSNDPANATDVLGLIDLNLFHPDDPAYAQANQVNIPGRYSVGGHGNGILVEGPTHTGIPPWILAKRILKDPNYKGQPVVLLACNAGQRPNSSGLSDSYAQYLAYYLGVSVSAPETRVTYCSGGRTELTDEQDNVVPGARLVEYKPENGKPSPLRNISPSVLQALTRGTNPYK